MFTKLKNISTKREFWQFPIINISHNLILLNERYKNAMKIDVVWVYRSVYKESDSLFWKPGMWCNQNLFEPRHVSVFDILSKHWIGDECGIWYKLMWEMFLIHIRLMKSSLITLFFTTFSAFVKTLRLFNFLRLSLMDLDRFLTLMRIRFFVVFVNCFLLSKSLLFLVFSC